MYATQKEIGKWVNIELKRPGIWDSNAELWLDQFTPSAQFAEFALYNLEM